MHKKENEGANDPLSFQFFSAHSRVQDIFERFTLVKQPFICWYLSRHPMPLLMNRRDF